MRHIEFSKKKKNSKQISNKCNFIEMNQTNGREFSGCLIGGGGGGSGSR